MNDTDLPSYSEERLASLDPMALIDLIVSDEDRVPRSVIDACVGRGEAMVSALETIELRPWTHAEGQTPGGWWLGLHAAMILGLIASESAGFLLVRLMRRMAEVQDDDLADWLAGYWPALFANKPDTALAPLRQLCGERALGWFMRANALDPVFALAERGGRETLDEALDWAARIAADEEEDWDMRLSCGGALLDFPRTRHRTLLEDLAKRQSGFAVHFSLGEVEKAYSELEDNPDWRRRDDPWAFYRPEDIAARQERWAREDAQSDADDVDDDYIIEDSGSPFIRATPKIGRNDPCPCGSGKKYKKCCLAGDPGPLRLAP